MNETGQMADITIAHDFNASHG